MLQNVCQRHGEPKRWGRGRVWRPRPSLGEEEERPGLEQRLLVAGVVGTELLQHLTALRQQVLGVPGLKTCSCDAMADSVGSSNTFDRDDTKMKAKTTRL